MKKLSVIIILLYLIVIQLLCLLSFKLFDSEFIILTIYFFMAYCLAIKPNKIFIKNCSCILLSFTLLANIFALFVLNNVVTVIEFRKENIQIFALGKHAVIFNCPNDKDVTDLSYYLRANNITNIDAIVIEDEVIPNSLYSFIKYFSTLFKI